eukprot:6492268-Amphidinium_carterae.3
MTSSVASISTRHQDIDNSCHTCLVVFLVLLSWQELSELVVDSVLPDSPPHEPDTLPLDGPAEENGQEEDNPLIAGAKLLIEKFVHKVGRLDCGSDVQQKQTSKRVHAAAEVSVATQEDMHKKVLSYVARMAEWKQLKPLMYVEKLAYDTTQLDIRVQYADQEGAHRQVASTHVVQHAWAVVFSQCLSADLQEPAEGHDRLCILTGRYGASIRASENTVGETTADVLNSIWMPAELEQKRMSKLFPTCVRFVEVDEAGSNGRAEALILEQRRGLGDNQWCHLHVLCLAHKVHAMAAKTWALQKSCISHIIAVCKHQHMAGHMVSLSDHAGHSVRQELRIVHEGYHLSTKARQFRKIVEQYFMPATSKPKLRSMFLAVLEYFNADWTLPTVVHVCTGCCASEELSRETGVRLLTQLVSCMHPHMFSRANWTSWADTLPFFGLACCFHDGLIAKAFVKAFRKGSSTTGAEENLATEFGDIGADPNAPQDVDNEQDRIRLENVRTLRMCLLFFSRRTEELMQDVFLLRICLQPELALMHAIIHTVSDAWETTQLKSMWSIHVREFRPLRLHKRVDVATFHQSVLAQFLDTTLWQWFVQTEGFASMLLQLSMRSGALAWQTVDLRVQQLPYKLFTLLERDNLEAKSSELLRIPMCGRDDFSKRFLQVHNSVEKLCSSEVHSTLYVLAHLWTSTTFATEALHARNLRRAKGRTMTKRIEVCDLAVAHSLAPHPWLQPAVVKTKADSEPTKRKSGKLKHCDAAPEKRRRANPGAGGAWRAFNHIQLGGRKFDAASVGELACAYRALSPQSKHYYETLGAAGSLQSWSQTLDTPAFEV